MADVKIKIKYEGVTQHISFFIGGQIPHKYSNDYSTPDVSELEDYAYQVFIDGDYLVIEFLSDANNNGYFKIIELNVDDKSIHLNNLNSGANAYNNKINYRFGFPVNVMS